MNAYPKEIDALPHDPRHDAQCVVQRHSAPTPAVGSPVHPGTGEVVGPDDLAPLLPRALIGQEMSVEPWIDIPGEVLDVLRLWRPTPLVRARRLEQALDTPARIYYKDESVSPAGSHKSSTAVAQAFYNKAEGIRRLSTETGAGSGAARCIRQPTLRAGGSVYMVAASYRQKPYRAVMMQTGVGRWCRAIGPDSDGQGNRGPRSPHQRISGHCHQRGRRRCRDPCRHALLLGLGAQSRTSARP